MSWSGVALLVGVLGPLVGVPLAAITLYLRAIHEHQTAGAAELTHRIEKAERCVREQARVLSDFERDFATKEEWLRESMHARQRLEHLSEVTIRVQTELEDMRGAAVELSRATGALVEIARAIRRDDCGEHEGPACAGACGFAGWRCDRRQADVASEGKERPNGGKRGATDQAGAERDPRGAEAAISGGNAG